MTREKRILCAKVFGIVLQQGDSPDWAVPDSMAFGAGGRLYCMAFAQEGVSVLDKKGLLAEVITTDRARTKNVAFWGDQPLAKSTEVENSALELLSMPRQGLQLLRPKLNLQ